jgi:hypothetical protein
MARFSLRQLEALVAVADTKNFNRAGDYMHLSSSTISNLIAELEDRLGFPVFDRTTRKVSLTIAGRALSGFRYCGKCYHGTWAGITKYCVNHDPLIC